jgi:Skp family chaperone for outer membrane proteins
MPFEWKWNHDYKDVTMDIKRDIKPTLLLALAIFMVSAPNPDAEAIAEITGGFIVPEHAFPLSADELRRPEEAQAESPAE